MNASQKAFLFATANPFFGGLAHLMAHGDAPPRIQVLVHPALALSSLDNPPRAAAIILVALRRGDEPACLVVLILVAPCTGLLAADDPVNNIDPSGRALGSTIGAIVILIAVSITFEVGLFKAIKGHEPLLTGGVENLTNLELEKIDRAIVIIRSAGGGKFNRYADKAKKARDNIQFVKKERINEVNDIAFTAGFVPRWRITIFRKDYLVLDDKLFAAMLLHEMVHHLQISMSEPMAYQMESDFLNEVSIIPGSNKSVRLFVATAPMTALKTGINKTFLENEADNYTDPDYHVVIPALRP